jgi:hypothetical protein
VKRIGGASLNRNEPYTSTPRVGVTDSNTFLFFFSMLGCALVTCKRNELRKRVTDRWIVLSVTYMKIDRHLPEQQRTVCFNYISLLFYFDASLH